MSSTYSTTLRIQLIDTGTEDEAWGTPTDNNLGTIIEQAITGVEAVSLTNLTSYTLTASNAVADQSRNAVLLFTGNLNANCNVIAPSVQKVYVISNQTTNNKAITIKTSSGNGVQLANGTNQLIYCNGTTFFSAVNVNTVLGDLAISGNANIAGTKITLGTSVISQNTSNLTFNAPTSNIISFQATTGAFTPPTGTVAQRPTPALGMGRWNSEYGWYEIWNGTIWQQITGSFAGSYLIVAGGGAGGYGSNQGGGGGAGGYLSGSLTLAPLVSFLVVVGAGGIATNNVGLAGGNGGNSSISTIGVAVGGGGGGGDVIGANGGSGGGDGGTGTTGQGNNGGGSGAVSGGGPYAGGGGGGANAVGQTAYQYFQGNAGAGGDGNVSSITGTATYYAGGGGGSATQGGGGGVGGLGGGGGGWNVNGAVGQPGTTSTGGGGGAGVDSVSSGGANGGSGVVIISYASTIGVRATGGTITNYSSGGNTYYVHKFTSSGTFTTITQELDMPSTYSPSLKIELIANGEQAGTWGQTTNNNMGTLIEQAITGVGSLDLTGYSSYTLTNYNGLADEARNAVLVFSGTPSSACNVIAPTVEKTYIVTNNASANVVIKTSAGNGITILPSLSALVYCDGSEFYVAVNVNNVIGDLTVSGNVSIAGGTINLASSSMVSNANSMTFRSSSGIINMNTNTGAFTPPTGTAAQRPASLALGMSRWNTDTGVYEIWTGTSWQVIASGTYTISYLIAGGGGAGGISGGGGGGAGGYLTGTTNLTPLSTYTITVGSGGTSGGSGGNSSISSIGTSVGGGAGGGAQNTGTAGGSGGGGGCSFNGGGSAKAGGSGTSGQGNAGGYGTYYATGDNIYLYGGGGGGAGAVGGDASYSAGGTGGSGNVSSITGSSITYSAGGTGANYAGGGGSSGTANSGNGGNGGGSSGGGNGGSGVVILSVPTASYSGVTTGTPTVTTNGANTILKYTSSGTYRA